MSLIDFILNVAGILLWLNWRSAKSDPFVRGVPATLSGTVRRAQPVRVRRWFYLATIPVLLLLRAGFYRLVGPAVDWTARLDLYFVVITFPEAHFFPALMFSVLSFLRAFLVFYFWLLVLAGINRDGALPNPIQRFIVFQLGPIARWSRLVQLTLVFLSAAALWILCQPALVYLNVISPVETYLHLGGQGLLVGVAMVLSLKYLLPALLAVHFVSSYVYFGQNALWNFVSVTAQNLLRMMRLSWLRVGKLDLAPVIGMVVILLVLEGLPGLTLWLLDRYGRTVWPH